MIHRCFRPPDLVAMTTLARQNAQTEPFADRIFYYKGGFFHARLTLDTLESPPKYFLELREYLAGLKLTKPTPCKRTEEIASAYLGDNRQEIEHAECLFWTVSYTFQTPR